MQPPRLGKHKFEAPSVKVGGRVRCEGLGLRTGVKGAWQCSEGLGPKACKDFDGLSQCLGRVGSGHAVI